MREIFLKNNYSSDILDANKAKIIKEISEIRIVIISSTLIIFYYDLLGFGLKQPWDLLKILWNFIYLRAEVIVYYLEILDLI